MANDEAVEGEEYSFAEMLKLVSSGQFHTDLTDAMKNLTTNMEQVYRSSGGIPKGQLNIVVKFKLDRALMEIDGTFNTKTPSPVRARTILYPDGKGNLRKNSYEQRQLPLGEAPRDVSTKTEIRDVRDFRKDAANDRP